MESTACSIESGNRDRGTGLSPGLRSGGARGQSLCGGGRLELRRSAANLIEKAGELMWETRPLDWAIPGIITEVTWWSIVR